MGGTRRCPSGHALGHGGRGRTCPSCRRDHVIAVVAAAEESLPAAEVAAAVDAVATNPARWRSLAAALADGDGALAAGVPPTVGRLVLELIARGSATLAVPACAVCGRTGRPLAPVGGQGLCARCAARATATECSTCGGVKPVSGRTADGAPICEMCRRHQRGRRLCDRCGKIASIAIRGRDGVGDLCVNCYRQPEALCGVCGTRRPCYYTDTDHPVCLRCRPRATAECARCGQDRPPTVRWDEGPLCDPCYVAALRHRGRCISCGQQRRLVTPPGPAATTCADCVGLAVTHTCTDCGIEDKMFEKSRCDRCSLRRRVIDLLSAGGGHVPAQLADLAEAITTTPTPRSGLNWVRTGAGSAILADLAAGRLEVTHQALDDHPRPKAADYLRHMLTTHGALPARDEELARTQQWLDTLLASITPPGQRRLLRSFATWRVMRRLRRTAEAHARPRTYTAHARLHIKTAVGFLAWLTARGRVLADCRQDDVDTWVTTTPSACYARDFLHWAADHGHCPAFTIPAPPRTSGTATDPDQRWEMVSRLLHDDTLHLVDRVAGCMVLLFGQQQSRIAAMTTDQITDTGDTVTVRFGRHDVPTPPPLGHLLLQLIRDGKSHVGIGSPAHTRWLFPGGVPGRPITASRLADRLRILGIPTQAGRRAALIDLAAQLPAAVLADLLGLHPTTAVKWMNQAGADWSRYAAELARTRNHQP